MKSRILFILFALFSLPFFSSMASAQELNEYAVKFVCGKGDGRIVAKGAYFTAINVHNPGIDGVGIRKKISVALPGEKAGKVTEFFKAELGPDESFEIDCPNILEHAGARGFLKGFVVIQSKTRLDVVTVYTATGETGYVQTMDIEKFKPHMVVVK